MCSSEFVESSTTGVFGTAARGVQNTIDVVRGKDSNRSLKELTRNKRRIAVSTLGPGGVIAQQFIDRDRDRTTPPAPVQATISTDSERQQVAAATARAEAERRRRQAAGAQSTIATSPLGITGGQASLGRTSLLGT